MATRPILHIRLDTETLARLDALARENGVNRSTAVRGLLAAALNDSPGRAAAREAIMVFASAKRQLFSRFSIRFQEVIAEVLREAFPDADLGELDANDGEDDE